MRSPGYTTACYLAVVKLDFLDERLPVYYREVLEKVKNNHRNNLELLAFGYLGFEVICNNID